MNNTTPKGCWQRVVLAKRLGDSLDYSYIGGLDTYWVANVSSLSLVLTMYCGNVVIYNADIYTECHSLFRPIGPVKPGEWLRIKTKPNLHDSQLPEHFELILVGNWQLASLSRSNI